MEIPPPAVLRSPLSVPRKLLMGPGPSNSSPRVLQALTQPVVGPMDEELLQVCQILSSNCNLSRSKVVVLGI